MAGSGRSPLISATALRRALDLEDPPVVLDVRWELGAGPQPDAYARGHIPGSVFLDLERNLTGPAGAQAGHGRHPLPSASAFTHAMRAAGVTGRRPVVVLDGSTGLAAARAWWLLRYFAHPDVSLLDGGLSAWQEVGGPQAAGPGPGGRVRGALRRLVE